jgi:hypothetical protein
MLRRSDRRRPRDASGGDVSESGPFRRIRTNGRAFQNCPTAEIDRILRTFADDLDQHRFAGASPRPLHDSDPRHDLIELRNASRAGNG